MLYSHLKCILSYVFDLIMMCFFYNCSNQLCTSICKWDITIDQSREFRNNFTLWKRERVSAISEDKHTMFMYLNSLCQPEMFATPSFSTESYMGLLLFILYFDSYQTCFYFFYSCYCISYNNTLESFLDEISVYHAMSNYDVMFIVKPIWHFIYFWKETRHV